jgi:hypothetical protein
MPWCFDRHERRAAARDHSRAFLDALTARRCDAVREGDSAGRFALALRTRADDARYRQLCRSARAAKRAALTTA